MQNRMIKYATVAVIVFVVIVGIVEFGETSGASAVFAAAMDNIRQARTCSCIEIFEMTYEDNEKSGTYLMKQKRMFKEPDWERHESLTSPWPRYVGEITIRDYGTRQELTIRPVEKTARFRDLASEYTVDRKTGELKLTQLNTRLRDRLLEWSEGAVEDHGSVELDGLSVMMLQSHRDNRVTTVWINPETDYPVQIEHQWTDQSRSPVLYTSIQIDAELDDNLFSLEPPEGYTIEAGGPESTDNQRKRIAKMMHLGLWCFNYASDNDGRFPGELADLVTAGIVTEEVLRRVRSAPDNPDGPPMIQYRQPDTSVEDRSIEVMLHEVHDEKSDDDLVVITMLDSHAEVTPVRVLKQYLKPWPTGKKKISACMAYLYGHCDRYAREHEEQYPEKLADLTSWDVSEETILRLQSAWNRSGEGEVILYRSPRVDADPAGEVMFYEICDPWSADGAVVCFADGHCELILDQNLYEQLIR